MSDSINNQAAPALSIPVTLPSDLYGCHRLIEELVKRISELQADGQRLEEKHRREIESLERTVQRLLLGNRRERFVDDLQRELAFNDPLAAMDLLLAELEGSAAADTGADTATPAEPDEEFVSYQRRKAKRPAGEGGIFPAHLPRREVTIEPSEELKYCEKHGERVVIKYDVTETLEISRPKLTVVVTKYPKLVCPGCSECGVVSPPRVEGLVAGNRFDSSVAAEIITGKYGYHLPIYRQQDLFASFGWTPSRSTLLNIATASAEYLKPLADYLTTCVLGDDIIGTDDTRTTLLLPPIIPGPGEDARSQRIHEVFTEALEAGKPSVNGRFWTYRGVTVPLVSFDFTVSRHRDGVDLMLQDYQGILLADCYSGYQGITLRTDGDIILAACGAHARRKIYDTRSTYPVESSLILSWYQQLYDIEDRARFFSAIDRFNLRQSLAKPIWAAMGEWLKSDAARAVLPASDFGKALNYLRNHWNELQVYLTDGRIPMDNNEVEQLMKRVATGRKNWLFVGSVEAGERAAIFMTLVASAVRNDLDVWAYLKDVLDQLLSGSTDYESLRPDNWAKTHPEFIRTYRVDERRNRAERKQTRREKRRQAQAG